MKIEVNTSSMYDFSIQTNNPSVSQSFWSWFKKCVSLFSLKSIYIKTKKIFNVNIRKGITLEGLIKFQVNKCQEKKFLNFVTRFIFLYGTLLKIELKNLQN